MSKFNSQVCTSAKQSQRLLELGLKPETADMYIFDNMGEYTEGVVGGVENNATLFFRERKIPAWSLHRLLCLYGQDYTIKEVYNDAEECYGLLISAIEIAIENDEFNKKYLDNGSNVTNKSKECNCRT